MRDSLASLRRIAAACRREPAMLSPNDAQRLAGAIEAASAGESWDAAMGLPADWRARWNQDALEIALGELAVPLGSERQMARAKETRLRRYRASPAFVRDMARGSSATHPAEFQVLRATDGRVPSAESIRKHEKSG